MTQRYKTVKNPVYHQSKFYTHEKKTKTRKTKGAGRNARCGERGSAGKSKGMCTSV